MTSEERNPIRPPPDNYSPAFGTREEYMVAVIVWTIYCRLNRHIYRACTQCADCEERMECGLPESNEIHYGRFEMRTGIWLLIFVALAISVYRFMIPASHVSIEGSYQAIAHLFVGGLIGAALATSDKRARFQYYMLAIAMSIVEIVAAIVTRL
jgi:hypothetical protein